MASPRSSRRPSQGPSTSTSASISAAASSRAESCSAWAGRPRQMTSRYEPYLNEMLPLIGAKKLCELTQQDLDGAKTVRPRTRQSDGGSTRHSLPPTTRLARTSRRWRTTTAGMKPARAMALLLFLTMTAARSDEGRHISLATRSWTAVTSCCGAKNRDPRQVELHPTRLEALREQVTALGLRP